MNTAILRHRLIIESIEEMVVTVRVRVTVGVRVTVHESIQDNNDNNQSSSA